MGRIIIKNDTELKDFEALDVVRQVIMQGRVSGNEQESYCYVTKFSDGIVVYADKLKCSDKFRVSRWSD